MLRSRHFLIYLIYFKKSDSFHQSVLGNNENSSNLSDATLSEEVIVTASVLSVKKLEFHVSLLTHNEGFAKCYKN